MNFFSGITYNLRGLMLGLKTPQLLMLGLARFGILLLTAVLCVTLVVVYYQDVMGLIWETPENQWLLWLWRLASWLMALLLMGLSTVPAYLLSQLFFSVLIMDLMSRVTESAIPGGVKQPEKRALLQQLYFLIKQEIPRATLPILCLLVVMVLGWVTPLGPFLSIAASGAAVIFLAWDNTDLVPARRAVAFRSRLKFLLSTLPFHLGFGLLFLVPGLNILLISFAPVGATRFMLDAFPKHPGLMTDEKTPENPPG
ncbi:MAG: hypothetical protein JRH15_23170 [Deltaproteobacteria bacterium]|nr:hypothetical protein [Deltaproteobacteria bacterium]